MIGVWGNRPSQEVAPRTARLGETGRDWTRLDETWLRDTDIWRSCPLDVVPNAP